MIVETTSPWTSSVQELVRTVIMDPGHPEPADFS
jgi:hypothetical protein